MSLVVEDGTGKSNANSYVSIAEADAYFLDANISEWAALTSAQKTAFLIKGTEYMEGYYGPAYAGYRLTGSQSLGWPRKCGYYDDVYPVTIIPALPQEIKNASYRAAYHALYGDIVEVAKTGIKSQTQGNISVTYGTASHVDGTVFVDVENAIKRVCVMRTGSIKLEREGYPYGPDVNRSPLLGL
jgi:hypothetical protein